MKKKKDPFADPKLVSFMDQQIIEGWKCTLDGVSTEKVFHPQRKEAYHACFKEETIKKLIVKFEARYGRKLKFRENGLFYISYVETELGEEYDDTILNIDKKKF